VASGSIPDTDLSLGLTEAEVVAVRTRDGSNEVVVAKPNKVLMFLKKFVGVTPFILEATVIAALGLQSWILAGVVALLLVVNAVIGFVQEIRAKRAMEMLEEALVITSRCLRRGEWSQIPARELVHGDVVRIRLGDLVPADLILLQDVENVTVDESALTGESVAVEKGVHCEVFTGSVIRTGEAKAVVIGTGERTKSGRSTKLVSVSAPRLHVERLIFRIILVLMIVALGFLVIGIIVLVANANTRSTFVANIPLFLSIVVSAVPAALPAMFSLTMALGSLTLAKQGVLVTRLTATEDAASMQVLCTDKTGTLTCNRIEVVGVFAVERYSQSDVVRFASYCSKSDNFDAIDTAILRARKAYAVNEDDSFELLEFTPFSAKTRKTIASVRMMNGIVTRITKGAIGVVLAEARVSEEMSEMVKSKVLEGSVRGHRSIAVSVEGELVGVLFFADPPRETSQQAILRMNDLGVKVLMVTGDSLPIAKFVAHQVGFGEDVRVLAKGESKECDEIDVENISGFAEIFPEEKHAIVVQLQKQGYIVGMTDDGVNDAAALKQAEVGVAMSNATDVAKAAASAVFLNEGLDAMAEIVSVGRQIHGRLRTWVLNIKIVKTFQTIGFVVLLFLIRLEWVVDPLNLICLLFLVDFVTLSISTDNARVAVVPCEWRVVNLTALAVVIGMLNVGESIGIFYIFVYAFNFGSDLKLQHTLCFEILLFFGLCTVFVVRESRHFYSSRPSLLLIVVSVADVIVALIVCSIGVDALALKQMLVWQSIIVLGWAVSWSLIFNDFVKVFLSFLWPKVFLNE
jgi:H+-transporting ATPase